MENRRANDNYGFVLAAQPGQSQGRPATTTDSWSILEDGCPTCVLLEAPDPVATTYPTRNRDPTAPLPWPYNHYRPHSALGMLTPAGFTRHWRTENQPQPQLT